MSTTAAPQVVTARAVTTCGAVLTGALLAVVGVSAPAAANSSATPRPTSSLEATSMAMLEGLIAKGVLTREQAAALVVAHNADAAARAAIVQDYERRAEAIVAAAYGMSVEQYRGTPVRRLPNLSRAQRAALQARLATLAAELRASLAARPLVAPSGTKRPLTVVSPKRR